jgi:hypothetical protein
MIQAAREFVSFERAELWIHHETKHLQPRRQLRVSQRRPRAKHGLWIRSEDQLNDIEVAAFAVPEACCSKRPKSRSTRVPSAPHRRNVALAQVVHALLIMDLVGHSTIKLPMDTYSHVMPALQREAADAMERALA